MATPVHCRACGQKHDPLLPCPKPAPVLIKATERLARFDVDPIALAKIAGDDIKEVERLRALNRKRQADWRARRKDKR